MTIVEEATVDKNHPYQHMLLDRNVKCIVKSLSAMLTVEN